MGEAIGAIVFAGFRERVKEIAGPWRTGGAELSVGEEGAFRNPDISAAIRERDDTFSNVGVAERFIRVAIFAIPSPVAVGAEEIAQGVNKLIFPKIKRSVYHLISALRTSGVSIIGLTNLIP